MPVGIREVDDEEEEEEVEDEEGCGCGDGVERGPTGKPSSPRLCKAWAPAAALGGRSNSAAVAVAVAVAECCGSTWLLGRRKLDK